MRCSAEVQQWGSPSAVVTLPNDYWPRQPSHAISSALNTHTLLAHTHTHTHTLILVDVEEFGHFVQICVFLPVFDDLEGRQKHVKSCYRTQIVRSETHRFLTEQINAGLRIGKFKRVDSECD